MTWPKMIGIEKAILPILITTTQLEFYLYKN
ncbi:MAG: hypothetical protein K0S07_1171 [Chlamydiales bacterium]|jgi:hypothetical protein|nr:hypothetical protein [Chlamydiales bacterium]